MLCDYDIRFSSGQIFFFFVPLLFFSRIDRNYIFFLSSCIPRQICNNIPGDRFYVCSRTTCFKSFSLLVSYQSPLNHVSFFSCNETFVCIASYPLGINVSFNGKRVREKYRANRHGFKFCGLIVTVDHKGISFPCSVHCIKQCESAREHVGS